MPSTSTAQTLPAVHRAASKRITRKRVLSKATTLQFAILALFILLGVWLRIAATYQVSLRSPDERTYAMEANLLREHGAAGLREAATHFQHDSSLRELPPPSRVLYIGLVELSMRLTGDTTASAGVVLACGASIASLLLLAWMGWEFFSPRVTVIAVLFYSISPIERIFAQRTWQESLIELIALAELYIAARMIRGARRWYWFASLAILGACSAGLKEVSFSAFLLCAAWVLWSLSRSRHWKAASVFLAACLTAVAAAITAYASLLGGFHAFVALTIANIHAQAGNVYSQQFEAGPPQRLLLVLFAMIPIVTLFGLPGIAVAWQKDHSVEGLVRDETVIRGLSFFILVYLAVAAFMPHRLNLRYICMIFAPFYLLFGLGFCWFLERVTAVLKIAERRIFIGFAFTLIVVGAWIDIATYARKLAIPAVDDLSARMILEATDPIGPIQTTDTDVAPDAVQTAENVVAQSPTVPNLLNLAIAYEQAGRYEACIMTSQKVLDIEPNSAEAYNDISAAAAGEQHWDAAIEAAEHAVQLRPNFQLAKNNLFWAQRQRAQVVSSKTAQ